MYDLSHVVTSSSPHLRAEDDTKSLMLDVVLALMPALAVAIFTFGGRALVITALTVASCVFFEWLYGKITKRSASIGDLSAVITGILIAFNVPVAAPLWLPVIGGAFAMIVVKMLFGGIGRNFMNPALAARAFMMASWPALMTVFVQPHQKLPLFGNVDAEPIAAATPLAALSGASPAAESLLDLFFGQHGGVIGETCALALLAGGAYLLVRRVITLRIPASFILTVAALSFLFPLGGMDRVPWMLMQVLSGGLLLGAIFMATDYVTSPVTPRGQLIFGIGCGLLTVFIRYFGGLPEGVSYAILIMNALTPLIDRKTLPRKFGYPKNKKEGEAV